MLNKIARFIAQHDLMAPERGTYVVALSGGADSVCLLLALRELGYLVEAAHCNFQLRGDESMRDEAFVRTLCNKLNIELHLIHFDTKTYAELHKVGIEMAARQLRYRYFEQLRRDIGAAGVCVAHHQDDSVETIAMNMLRGTGLRGLTGIQPRQGHILRPLLCLSRREIEQWLANEQHQDYITDSTNLQRLTARNVLRLDVFPRLAEWWPTATEGMLTTARRVAEAMRVYDAAIRAAIRELIADDSIAIDDLRRQPSPESLLFE